VTEQKAKPIRLSYASGYQPCYKSRAAECDELIKKDLFRKDFQNMQSISPKQLCELSQRGIIDLIDVRTPAEFGDTRANCARNVPLDALNPKAVVAARNGNADQPLYVICKSGGRSAQAVKKFVDAGFTNIVDVEGGTNAWVAAGLPVIRGKKAISIDRQMRILAGTLVLAGVGLSFLHPYFIGLSAFIGAGLVFAGVTDFCPMMNGLSRMPWNQAKRDQSSCKV
jgi:rhodanese-related sulfurtransferase